MKEPLLVERTDQIAHLTLKYQKRFIRYRNSLFTFLDHDAIPWHNDTAEGAMRHVAKQRDISMRLLLDSRVVGFADVIQPHFCHPYLLEPLLFQWP
jgi:hypothetical protein